jgi:hypothetical protein
MKTSLLFVLTSLICALTATAHAAAHTEILITLDPGTHITTATLKDNGAADAGVLYRLMHVKAEASEKMSQKQIITPYFTIACSETAVDAHNCEIRVLPSNYTYIFEHMKTVAFLPTLSIGKSFMNYFLAESTDEDDSFSFMTQNQEIILQGMRMGSFTLSIQDKTPHLR